MDITQVREYCLQKTASSESCPFGDDLLVFKVVNKMFAILSLTVPYSINLKCDPDWAVTLRDSYTTIKPGYHMNKKHWNTIMLDGTLPAPFLQELIDHSYTLVVAKLKKADRERIVQK